MASWNYTQTKKTLEFCFANNDFAPSTKYKTQSPFNATKSYPSKSTWDLWFVELSNYSCTFTGQDVILVKYNIEAVLMLIEDVGIAPASITLLSDNDNKTALAQAWGVTVITDCKEIPKMKFTHTIKNPPWDGGIYKDYWPLAHEELVNDGYQLDILPTNWMTLISFATSRKYLLDNFEILSIRIYDNSKGQVFEAVPGGDVVVMVSRKSSNPNNSLVEYTYFDNPTFTVDLTRHEIWPMYTTALSVKIWDMVVSKKINDLNWDKTEATPYFVSAPTKVHQRINPNFMKNPGSRWDLNTLKGIADEQQFFFDTNEKATFHHEWFSDDAFAYVLAMAKSQGKNQPHPIAYTGEHDFTNNNFVSHFGFTKQHLDEIAQWKLKA